MVYSWNWFSSKAVILLEENEYDEWTGKVKWTAGSRFIFKELKPRIKGPEEEFLKKLRNMTEDELDALDAQIYAENIDKFIGKFSRKFEDKYKYRRKDGRR